MRVHLYSSFWFCILNFSRQMTKRWHNHSWKLRLYHLANKLPGTWWSINEAVSPLFRLDKRKDSRVQMKIGLIRWWKTCVSFAAVGAWFVIYQSRIARSNLCSHRSYSWLLKLSRSNDFRIARALSQAVMRQNEANNWIPINFIFNGLLFWHLWFIAIFSFKKLLTLSRNRTAIWREVILVIQVS